jgi:hypothetical protein
MKRRRLVETMSPAHHIYVCVLILIFMRRHTHTDICVSMWTCIYAYVCTFIYVYVTCGECHDRAEPHWNTLI